MPMGKTTEIAWCSHTFNGWIGCTKVSEGCKNCYAATRDARHMLGPVSHWGPGAPRHVTSESNWRQPLAWARAAKRDGVRRRVFCASLADVFEAEAPVEARRRLWKVIGETYMQLDWLLCTKRPERIIGVMDDDGLNFGFFDVCKCWLLTSTENQEQFDKRVPYLLDVDAAVHGVSIEPMLGPVNLHPWARSPMLGPVNLHPWARSLSWAIVGGESGPGARPCNVEWMRSIVEQCKTSGTACFVKQLGAVAQATIPNIHGDLIFRYTGSEGKKKWGAGSDPAEWPADLRVQQFPETATV